MDAIIPLTRGMLHLGIDLIERRQFAEGVRVLRRLLDSPDLEPMIAAEANRLLAEAHFARADFASVQAAAQAALLKNPRDANAHFFLGMAAAKASETQAGETENADDALTHLSEAVRLDPADARKQSAYGLQMVRSRRKKQGLAILGAAYRKHPADADVANDYAEALFEADLSDEAELFAIQAAGRNEQNGRFRRLKERVRQRAIARRLEVSAAPRPQARSVIPFRNFERPESNRPRSSRKPSAKNSDEAQPATHSIVAPPMLNAETTFVAALKRFNRSELARIGESLGLFPSGTGAVKRTDIVRAFADEGFVRNFVQSLPIDSRKLLRTLVRAGGFMPASVLFQNTGPDAPPPDYAQPLLAAAVCLIGQSDEPIRADEPKLVALIPVDLRGTLAKALKIKNAG